ncbi:hypothetical protein BDK51DRAFT_33242 [Blyttiomyces helicus]|uniref:Uncharacterized protein n=1 Tax=Blyttiomyces helicus TaxID=388810 RepID=A0A4V1IPR1_9FUNG|nr:hypothetical protein BDK51DRAFT_33242 [Blyttiomyces helicus]|eukprot:RKO83937.1 hypothetical protein BDK51DRAFT_33242 [Blyttiomyces helicus]
MEEGSYYALLGLATPATESSLKGLRSIPEKESRLVQARLLSLDAMISSVTHFDLICPDVDSFLCLETQEYVAANNKAKLSRELCGQIHKVLFVLFCLSWVEGGVVLGAGWRVQRRRRSLDLFAVELPSLTLVWPFPLTVDEASKGRAASS